MCRTDDGFQYKDGKVAGIEQPTFWSSAVGCLSQAVA